MGGDDGSDVMSDWDDDVSSGAANERMEHVDNADVRDDQISNRISKDTQHLSIGDRTDADKRYGYQMYFFLPEVYYLQ